MTNTVEQHCQLIADALMQGNKIQVEGLGTFSTCSRKATSTRAACKIAMFRPKPELLDFSTVAEKQHNTETFSQLVIEELISEQQALLPGVGILLLQVQNGKTSIKFKGDETFNRRLSNSMS